MQIGLDEKLSGDRVRLPVSMLITTEDILVYSINDTVCSVREFTAPEGMVLVSPLLYHRLVKDTDTVVYATISPIQPMKLEYVKLQPTQPIDPSRDIKSLLEAELRSHYTVLKQGDVIQLYSMDLQLRILEMKPEPVGICINTDVEVDIETLAGSVLVNEWVKYSDYLEWNGTCQDSVSLLAIPIHTQAKSIEYQEFLIQVQVLTGDLNLFVSNVSSTPSRSDHMVFDIGRGNKEVLFLIEEWIDAFMTLYIGIEAYPSCEAKIKIINRKVSPRASSSDQSNEKDKDVNDTEGIDKTGQKQCSNCGTWVREQTISMHEAFCHRNNTKCSTCSRVFRTQDFQYHYHCPHCDFIGHTDDADKHVNVWHAEIQCSCGHVGTLAQVSNHKQSCPDRLLVCRYCHLVVKAGPKSTNVRDKYLGLDLCDHESECGSRTIQCRQCSAQVRLKDVPTHSKIHTLKVLDYKLCTNTVCSNSQNVKFLNVLQVCQTCFQDFWSPDYDPGNQKLAQRIVKRYHQQLTVGCGKSFCYNKYCCTSNNTEFCKEPLDPTTSALEAIQLLKQSAIVNQAAPVHYFCVASSTIALRRQKAEQLYFIMDEKVEMGLCCKALLESKDDIEDAVRWLSTNMK